MLHISNKNLQSEKTHRKWRSCFQQGNQNKHCQPEQQIWSVHNCHLNTLYSTRLPILNMVVITHKKKVQREEIWHIILIFLLYQWLQISPLKNLKIIYQTNYVIHISIMHWNTQMWKATSKLEREQTCCQNNFSLHLLIGHLQRKTAVIFQNFVCLF